MDDEGDANRHSSKAAESLAGAASEFSNSRYNNSANRSYYACFQSAIAALIRARIRPERQADRWPHAFVISQFVGQLIHRRHQFSAELRRELNEIQRVRHEAEYRPDPVSEFEAYRTLHRARAFYEAVRQDGDDLR